MVDISFSVMRPPNRVLFVNSLPEGLYLNFITSFVKVPTISTIVDIFKVICKTFHYFIGVVVHVCIAIEFHFRIYREITGALTLD